MAPHSHAGVSCTEWGGTFDSTPNRMDESFIITVAGCSVLGGGLLVWLLTRPAYRLRVTPMPVTVAHYDHTFVAVALESKRRLGLSWKPASGTFIVQRGSEGRAAVSPSLGTTDTSGAPLELQVTGLQPGVDRFRVSATPLGRKAALVANIPVTITEDARGSRRIRHTAAVLTDPGRPSA